MDEEAVRRALGSLDFSAETSLEILHAITRLVNELSTHNKGRELVIRALAVKEQIPADQQLLLDSLVRTVGLLPYADASFNSSLEDYLLMEAHRVPLKSEGLLFHTLQLQIFRDLLAGRNVVLSATTSVGKSLVVDALIASRKHDRIAIIVPTIALIDETRRRLGKQFGETHEIVTHPTQRPSFQRPTIFVLTQERALSRSDLSGVKFFVIDEFYKLDIRNEEDTDRSVDLNLCFHKLAGFGAQFYLIGPHISAVDGLASGHKHVFIPSEFSTVALDVVFFGLKRHGDDRKAKLVALCKELTSPTLIYCQSPAKAAEAAGVLLADGFLEESSATTTAVDWLSDEYPSEWVLIQALRFGVGIHHGNVPRAIQQYMVRAFDAGTIKFLICTSTIIEGVNTVAENVILYDKRKNNRSIDYFTFRNIAGRAGRMTKYFIGKVFVLEEPPEAEDHTVEMAVEMQSEETPLSLILDLPDDDLAPVSKKRISDLLFDSPLSLETLRANRHIPIDVQTAVYEEINRDLMLYRDALVWSGIPAFHQLRAVCDLIFDYIDRGLTLRRYMIFSGSSLAFELNFLRHAQTFRAFIDHFISRRMEGESTSDAVERTLRFLRKYVGYTFPRHLTAIETIKNEVLRNAGYDDVGDYSYFAARTESLYIDTGLFALDEYGIPPELARRLARKDEDVSTLDLALGVVSRLNLNSDQFHPFEREIIGDVIQTLPPRIVA